MFRVAVFALALTAGLGGCASKGAPEQVADAFAEAYFVRADQEKAKEYTALGATQMLDAELKSVAQIRKEGYNPADAVGARILLRRGKPTTREQRIRFPFELRITPPEGAETVREADVELTQIEGAWKVVRVGLTSFDGAPPQPPRP